MDAHCTLQLGVQRQLPPWSHTSYHSTAAPIEHQAFYKLYI